MEKTNPLETIAFTPNLSANAPATRLRNTADNMGAEKIMANCLELSLKSGIILYARAAT
ncbi:hypothetical protein MTHERMOG20_03200 [Moorella thermoacetica]|nr:hypothetical protein MTHERMOG20_03200 [Moorella thermoacetica]